MNLNVKQFIPHISVFWSTGVFSNLSFGLWFCLDLGFYFLIIFKVEFGFEFWYVFRFGFVFSDSF